MRRGTASFQSTTDRPDITGKKKIGPPIGLYEHRFGGIKKASP